MKRVWVVVDISACLDNIVGVFDEDKVSEEKLAKLFDEEYYEVRSVVVYDNLEMFQ